MGSPAIDPVPQADRAFAEREPVRVVFGFNADEGIRISKAQKYDTPLRHGWYPLVEWGMNRETCLRYLKEVTGETWLKSACIYCPYNALKQDGIERMRQFPELVAEALLLEHQSLSFNPRGTLYRGRTLLSIITENQHTVALRNFRMRLEAAKYALYRVRRIYKAPGHADRAVEKLMTGSRAEMNACFEDVTSGHDLESYSEYHQRQLVDISSPTYKRLPLQANPADGSRRILQVRPPDR